MVSDIQNVLCKATVLSNAQKEEETERWAHDGNDDSGDENDDDVERK